MIALAFGSTGTAISLAEDLHFILMTGVGYAVGFRLVAASSETAQLFAFPSCSHSASCTAVIGSIAWSIGILAVFAPLAIHRFHKTATR